MSKKIIIALGVCGALLLAVVLIAGSNGPAIAQDASEPTPPETCTICHPGAGAKHQASYDELYQDGAIQVTDLAYEYSSPGTHIVTFQMTKNGAPFDVSDADSRGIYFVPWTGEAFQFEPAAERLSLMGELTYDGEGGNTSTLTSSDAPYASDLGDVDGLIIVYGADETVGRLPARIRQVKYPFAALLETGAGVDVNASSGLQQGRKRVFNLPDASRKSTDCLIRAVYYDEAIHVPKIARVGGVGTGQGTRVSTLAIIG